METKEKKAPVDIKEIIARANEKTAKVNQSTEKIQAQKDTYRVLPEYTKYEWNGVILRSVGKQNILTFKTGTKKYQLFHKDGTRRNISKEDIKAMFKDEPIEKVKKVKPVTVKKQKLVKEIKTSISKEKIQDLKSNNAIKSILEMDIFNHEIQYRLSLAGLSKEEISAVTNTPMPSTIRNLWYYSTGKKSI